MSLINKEYYQYNKSFWFLTPLIVETGITKKDFLIDTHLINTYITCDSFKDKLKRPLILHYKYENSKLFKEFEEYVQLDLNSNKFIDIIDINTKEVLVVYDIINDEPYSDNLVTEYDRSCVTDYDNFIKGKYSKLSGSHKYKTLKFHYDLKYKPTDMLYMLFRKDDILWHERRKVLGCHNKIKCKCIIDTEFKTSGKVEILYPKQEQNYVKCKNYEPWKMPAEVELDDKPDLTKENYGLERSIKTLS